MINAENSCKLQEKIFRQTKCIKRKKIYSVDTQNIRCKNMNKYKNKTKDEIKMK